MQYPLTTMAQEGLSFIVARLHPERHGIVELRAAGVSPSRIEALYPLDADFYKLATDHLLDHLTVKQSIALHEELKRADLEDRFRPFFHAPLLQAYGAAVQHYYGVDFAELLAARVHNLILIAHIIATYDHDARLKLLADQDVAHRATGSRWRDLHKESMRFWDALQALEAATAHTA